MARGRAHAPAWLLAAALACLAARPALAEGAPGVRPLVSVLLTCSALAPDTYPANTQNWFDATRDSQVVFFAHLLFPLDPLPDEAGAPAFQEPWHPPMAVHPPDQTQAGAGQRHYAEVEWLDPTGRRLALFGETLTARPSSTWLDVDGRSYMAHTVAMAIGTRDLRPAAGQVLLPGTVGQYTVRLRVDGRSVGLAFFRMLRTAPPLPKSGTPSSESPSGSRSYRVEPSPAYTPLPTPVPIPTLPSLRLP